MTYNLERREYYLMGGVEWVLCKYGLKWIGVGWNGFFMQNSMIIYKCQSRKSRTLKNKISRSHYKILSKLTEICWRWLSMTSSYFMQSSVARITRGSHIKSRTLEIKPHVHTIKFYRNWLNFFEDDSVWLGATLCKAV